MTSYASPTRELLEMLSYGRPHGSKTEAAFVQKYIMPLPGMQFDKFGNGLLRIGTAPIMWSCHTDSVHFKEGLHPITVNKGLAKLAKPAKGVVLGADDAAGVWLMCEMIRAETSGLYIFHCGEEVGGLGSDWLAKNTPHVLDDIAYAIALDRKGNDSVITHQSGRCCSDAFALSLASKLGDEFRPDSTGLFTDTANYIDLVGECSNISVGYECAHTQNETLDLNFLCALRDTLIGFDCTGLVSHRAAGEVDDEYAQEMQMYEARKKYAHLFGDDDQTYYIGANGTGYEVDSELDSLCKEHPEGVSDMLRELDVDADDVRDWLCENGYIYR